MSKIIAIDFDGTLCVHKYPGIGDVEEIHLRVHDYLREQKEKHQAIIILWTCRAGIYLNQAVQWCRRMNIPIDYVNENIPEIINEFGGDTRKIVATEYIDDRAINPINL